ncbi:AbiJ-NTD4 domain-containing protein [Lactiplantibacillus argentoratensis]|uniref:AbiJ-NTD4 domain-containing protein n=1 Tax=Lactiplantibacillus argentoratensis TaxID=271881 RepID=UPI003F5308E4
MKFSERMGFVEVDDVLQVNSMSADLKNDIFNYCITILFDRKHDGFNDYHLNSYMMKALWLDFFHRPLVSLNVTYKNEAVKKLFKNYSSFNFYEVYDFLEYVMTNWSEYSDDIDDVNFILSQNHSGYRFIEGQLEPISSTTDITTVKSGLKTQIDDGHLQNALNELGKRSDINLNTVMKESIDAVEAATHYISTRLFNGGKKDTMGRNITILKDNKFIENHPAYLTALSNLYGYSSDGGIRHPKDREYKVDQAEATFMLEICSAFISMLKFKLVEYQNNHK